MNIRGILKGFIVAVSYHSLKKVIDGYPQPYRNIVTFLFRLSVFFIIFLSLFAFFTGRIYSIASNIQSPGTLTSILVGMSFILSLVVSFLLTAVIEEIYRKISEVKQQAQQSIEAVKDKAQVPGRVIKSSVQSAKTTLSKTGQLIGESSKKLYDVSSKITNVAVDSSVSGFKKIAGKIKWKKTKKKESGDNETKARSYNKTTKKAEGNDPKDKENVQDNRNTTSNSQQDGKQQDGRES